MIAWWWLIPAIMISAVFGVFLMGTCCANNKDDRNKWWNE